jgi:hypothetical protein
MREMKDPRMKNLTNLVSAILTSSILIYLILKSILFSLKFVSHEDYQEKADAPIYYSPTLQEALQGSYRRAWWKTQV